MCIYMYTYQYFVVVNIAKFENWKFAPVVVIVNISQKSLLDCIRSV